MTGAFSIPSKQSSHTLVAALPHRSRPLTRPSTGPLANTDASDVLRLPSPSWMPSSLRLTLVCWKPQARCAPPLARRFAAELATSLPSIAFSPRLPPQAVALFSPTAAVAAYLVRGRSSCVLHLLHKNKPTEDLTISSVCPDNRATSSMPACSAATSCCCSPRLPTVASTAVSHGSFLDWPTVHSLQSWRDGTDGGCV